MENHKLIYIIRHGQTEYNKKKMVQGSGVDSDLNDTGRAQALAFYEKYRDLPFELVISSGLKRTHQTVNAFIEQGINWIQMPEINEISWGKHEGMSSTPDMIAQYQHMTTQWAAGNYDTRIPEGESAQDLADRMTVFVETLKKRPEKLILVCSHGRAMRCMMCLLKNKPISNMDKFSHSNTGLYKTRFTGDHFVFELENDTSHLG